MTFKEAKNILKKEFAVINLHKSTEPFEFDDSNWFGYEKPSVLEAFRVLAKEGYYISISGHDYNMREKRLQKEYEKNTKAPGPGEEQPNEGNPALKESAFQFNDALLDEQGKKIAELTKKNERLGKEIARLNKVIYKKNLKIEELKKESSEHLDGKVKYYGETVDLSQELCDKNEDIRLSKIREKNLVEISQKYMKENEELKEKLKSINMAAEKMIQKMAKAIVGEKPICSEDFEQYRRWANGYRYNPQLYDFIEEEEKKLNTAKMVDINAKCMRAARESINDVFESYAAKYAKSSLDDLKEKAYELFNAKAQNLGLVGSKDGNGIIDQMIGADIAEEGGDQSATIVQCDNGIILSKEEAEIIERCTKNGTELHYSEKDGLTYTNMFGEEIPIICLRGMFHVFTDEEIKNMKK
jgi:hypothetical protein